MNLDLKKVSSKLKSRPKNWKMLLIYWGVIFFTTILVFSGYYRIGRSLAYGLGGLPSINAFIGREVEEKEPFSTTLPGISTPVVIPEGVLETWDGAGRVTVLLMGLDYRDWQGGPGPSRTDTMMLLTMDPLNNTAGMFSIPRDLWVSIPGFDNNRINTAFFLGERYQLPGGGPAMAVRTVEQLLGVKINYYAIIDFGAFVRFIEELHGVKINVPAAIRVDPIVGKPVNLEPGIQTLTGELALAYARARNTARGDLDRAIRQQQVILGIRDRLINPDSLSELIKKAPSLYLEISRGVATNLTLDETIKLALMAQKIPEENIRRVAISPSEVIFATTPNGASVLLPLTEKIRQLRDEVFLETTGTIGPLTQGTQQEKMTTEAARIALADASLVNGLLGKVQGILQANGAQVSETTEWEFQTFTRIIDYTGNPHTVRYLIEFFDINPKYYELQFDHESLVDVRIIIGSDFENKLNE